ncbi:hypothetical protein SmJEL517_g00915 [Synchytrium microbalum]|uniref:UBC core domain-containing protein n=1 Tax=Synchytrium microbalum TaxID=1806994 RepID=A0A507CBD5_9FUNG|nr:uncharacterized protein SmJEL517_g00915 [Synchytrium microbalum]TPX36932.1 hypothetical protein SmJEL517_g00915 [Synchytrium microbalum]
MSRAVLLLMKELWLMERSTFPTACIHGLVNTPWEGGIFKLELLFPENWNETPPAVYFVTVPFHPNINLQTGRPCVDFLDDVAKWSPKISIVQILVYLQAMLESPILENAVNGTGAQIYATSPRLYTQLVRDCVIASRRIDAGLSPHEDPVPEVETLIPAKYTPLDQPPGTKSTRGARWKVHQVSFEEYYEHWKATATTIPPAVESAEDLTRHRLEILQQHRSQYELYNKRKAKPGKQPRGRVSQLQHMFRRYFDMNKRTPIPSGARSPVSGWHSDDEAEAHHKVQHQRTKRTASVGSDRAGKSTNKQHTSRARMTIIKDFDELEDDLLDWASNLDEDEGL